ncbi:unnamed protein product [Discosporangium mesarthrocarpum]
MRVHHRVFFPLSMYDRARHYITVHNFISASAFFPASRKVHRKVIRVNHRKVIKVNHRKVIRVNHRKVIRVNHRKVIKVNHRKVIRVNHRKVIKVNHRKHSGEDCKEKEESW